MSTENIAESWAMQSTLWHLSPKKNFFPKEAIPGLRSEFKNHGTR